MMTLIGIPNIPAMISSFDLEIETLCLEKFHDIQQLWLKNCVRFFLHLIYQSLSNFMAVCVELFPSKIAQKFLEILMST